MKNFRMEDKFIVLQELGKGAFSKVYKVKRIQNGKIYALKKVPLQKLNSKEIENSLNEIRILASIKHPNIVGFKEAFIDQQKKELNIIMEYLGGGDLSQRIKECKEKRIRFPENMIIRFFHQMTSALYELHIRKVIHRDLKTANIFITKDLKNLKIGDMNVSKIIKNNFAYTQTGTPYYASPEVWRDDPYNIKTDIWSLGCVLYELCMLKPPFNATDMDGLFTKVQQCNFEPMDNFYSKKLIESILKLLTINPYERPSCEKILNFSIFEDLRILLNPKDNSVDRFYQKNDLIKTIKASENFFEIQNLLPISQYSEIYDQINNQNMNENFNQNFRPLKNLFKKKKKSTLKQVLKTKEKCIQDQKNKVNLRKTKKSEKDIVQFFRKGKKKQNKKSQKSLERQVTQSTKTPCKRIRLNLIRQKSLMSCSKKSNKKQDVKYRIKSSKSGMFKKRAQSMKSRSQSNTVLQKKLIKIKNIKRLKSQLKKNSHQLKSVLLNQKINPLNVQQKSQIQQSIGSTLNPSILTYITKIQDRTNKNISQIQNNSISRSVNDPKSLRQILPNKKKYILQLLQKNLNQNISSKNNSAMNIIKRLKTAKTKTSKIALSQFSRKKTQISMSRTPNIVKNSIIIDKKRYLKGKKRINIEKFLNFLKTPQKLNCYQLIIKFILLFLQIPFTIFYFVFCQQS